MTSNLPEDQPTRHGPFTTGRPTDRPGPDGAVAAGQPRAGTESRHESPAPSPSPVQSGRRSSVRSSVRTLPGAAHRPPGRRGPGRRGIAELSGRLSPRDVAVLDLLAEHRFLTTHHVRSFCFHDHATPASAARGTRRVLARLQSEGLIDRPARQVGGLYGGSEAYVWRLTGVGHRLRSLRSGDGAATRVRTPGPRFVEHYLAVADVRLKLIVAERHGDLRIGRTQVEPVCWQPFTGLGGSREILKPDLAATTTPTRDPDFEDHWYVEVDRATESIPTLLRQCRAYEACRASGVVQDERGIFPTVVWVVPTERRAGNLRTAIGRARGLDRRLYRVCVYEEFTALMLGGAA